MSPDDFSEALALRLILPVVTHDPLSERSCGICDQQVQIEERDYGYHALSCVKNPGRTSRHNAIVDALASLASSMGCTVEKEAMISARSEHRVDLRLNLRGALFLVDVTVVNPALESRIRRVNNPARSDNPVEPGYASLVVEKLKTDKYSRVGVPMDVFVPFVVENTGRLGPKAVGLLEKLCPEEEADEDASTRNARTRSFFFRRLGCQLQSQNAKMLRHYRHNIRHTIPRAA